MSLAISLLLCAIPAVIAGSAHMALVRLRFAPWLAVPLDGGRSWHGRRIFGDNKTWRGLISMVLLSIIGCYVLELLLEGAPGLRPYNLFDFDRYGPAFYGVLYGFGYSLFELPNSFLKRQRGIRPGQKGALPFVLLDQADSVFGCLILLYPFSRMSIAFVVAGVAAFTALHMGMNYLLYVCKLREEPL